MADDEEDEPDDELPLDPELLEPEDEDPLDDDPDEEEPDDPDEDDPEPEEEPDEPEDDVPLEEEPDDELPLEVAFCDVLLVALDAAADAVCTAGSGLRARIAATPATVPVPTRIARFIAVLP